MSHDPNHNMQQQEQQPCFSDFLLGYVGQEECMPTGFNFNTTPDVAHRYHSTIPQNGISNPVLSHPSEIKRLIENDVAPGDDNVFAPQTSYFDQPLNQQPFVSYSDCQNQHQQHLTTAAYSNGQMTGQNFNGYTHTSSPNSGDRASISNSPYTPTVRQEYPISPPGGTTQQQQQKAGSIPSLSNYPGDCKFEVYFGANTEHAVKSAQFTHSALLGKLFVKMNTLCPIQFRCENQPPEGSIIRALPVYTRPEHVTEVVSRCPNHQIQDSGVDRLSRHLIRAEQPGNNSVQYGITPDGRESVIVAYIAPEIGTQYITVFYKYMCLSSCVGGINRRPIKTVFTLESPDGTVLGRRCVEVRICSCPGRDRSQEERRKRKPCVPPGYVLLPKKKKPSSMPSTSTSEPEQNGQEFFLRIKGKEKYEILKKIKEALDLKELISPEQKEEYEQREASEEASSMKLILSSYFKQLRDGDDDPFPT